MEIILSCVLGIIIGAGIIYVFLRTKLKQTQKIDNETIEKNILIKNEYNQLLKDKQLAKSELVIIEQKTNDLKKTYQEKSDEYYKLRENYEKESKNSEKAAQLYYDKMIDIQKKKLEYDLKEERKKYNEAINDYQQEYTSILSDAVDNYQKEIAQQNAELALLKNSLDCEKAIVIAAIEANKRAKEISEKENFYRLILSNEDFDEIQELRKCAKFLRNPEPLNKIIWKTYYEKPYSDLIGRVIGSGIHCGIYKITNLKNNMCYVGQAVNIAERWKQHIKRGLGADTPTRNKLYPAMLLDGVENFSFEIIEECDRSLLNEREDFWQDYFGAKEFGYSIK